MLLQGGSSRSPHGYAPKPLSSCCWNLPIPVGVVLTKNRFGLHLSGEDVGSVLGRPQRLGHPEIRIRFDEPDKSHRCLRTLRFDILTFGVDKASRQGVDGIDMAVLIASMATFVRGYAVA